MKPGHEHMIIAKLAKRGGVSFEEACACAGIDPAGAPAEIIEKICAPTWKHDALAVDLSRWLKSGGEHWCWLNSALGEWSGPRPDVMAYRRFRYQTPVIRAYEAKVSRADLLSDLRAEKWSSYLEHCMSVTFIMPSGLCAKSEIPAECGVMFRSGRGWRTERRPQDIGVSASMTALAKLLTMHPLVIASEKPSYREGQWRDQSSRAFTKAMGAKLGAEAARYFENVAAGRDPVAHARTEAARILEGARADAERVQNAMKPVLDALGLADGATNWAITSALKKRADLLSADGQLDAVRSQLAAIERAVAEAKSAVSPTAAA